MTLKDVWHWQQHLSWSQASILLMACIGMTWMGVAFIARRVSRRPPPMAAWPSTSVSISRAWLKAMRERS